MGSYVYKYVYNDEIIYIGKNDTNLIDRINQHKLEDKFKPYLQSCNIYYIKLANKTMSDVIESELIRRYKPKLNIAKMSEWSGIEFVEPKWELYIEPIKTKKSSNKTLSNVYSKNKQNKIMKYNMMANYYCVEILKNIKNAIESDEYYDIKVPRSEEDPDCNYCTPLSIMIDNEKIYAGLSLGCCYSNDNKNIIFRFKKSNLFEDFYGVEVGLLPRVRLAQKIYKEELIKIR